MGRRAKGPILDGTEPVEGIDTDGRLFFEKPRLMVVGKAEEIPVTTFGYPRTHTDTAPPEEDLRTTTGKLRLVTSRNYQVCSQQPGEVEYQLSQLPTYKEVKDYLKQKRIDGYGAGAIVARRYQNDWRFKHPGQWGIIMYEVGNPSLNQRWAPYSVYWFEQSAIFQNEKAWAEDLVIIHTHLDDSYLQDILRSQGIGRSTGGAN
jgi:hypothetical protein